jgi:hypothetical protein
VELRVIADGLAGSACFSFLVQFVAEHIAWLCHAIIFFWSAFDDAWFKTIRPFWIDFQVTQLRAKLGISQSAKRVREADAFHGNPLALGCLVHHGPNQVVDQGEHGQFFADAVYRLTMQGIHFHGLF